MIAGRAPAQCAARVSAERGLGTVGYLAIAACSVIAVMITPAERLPLVAAGWLAVAALLYRGALRRLLGLRWVVMIALLALPTLFLVGDPDRTLFGVAYSIEGAAAAAQIALRMLVVLAAIQGLNSTVDIASVAGLLERAGMRGLGFSMGVALNLLPALQQSAQNSWRSLRMRGGLRKRRGRALLLLAVTIATGALSRAEEIGLAAEARAFSPERARSMPVKVGKGDWAVLVLCITCTLLPALV